MTDEKFESQNITDAQRQQGASSGRPIQNIKDYGFEVGGPIKKGKRVDLGRYRQADHRSRRRRVLPADGNVPGESRTPRCSRDANRDINACLNTDLTELQTTNLKGEVQLFKGNKLSLYNLFSKKVRNARNASDTTPIEWTVRQAAVSRSMASGDGRRARRRPTSSENQWVVGDRMLLDVQYAHVGKNFILDFHEDALKDVAYSSWRRTINGRSTPDGWQSVNIRPRSTASTST